MERDELAAVRSAMAPAWDELREQRVLRGSFESRVHRARKRRVAAMGSAGVVALLTIALVVGLAWPRHEAVSVSGITSAPATGSDASVLVLADGSKLLVGPKADLRVESQEKTDVRVAQRSGEVHYDVSHDPQRQFTVRASDVFVRVRGTAFVISVETDSILVRVERGRVSVEDASGTAELGAGEEIRRVKKAPASEEQSAGPAEIEADQLPRAEVDPAASVDELLGKADRARAAGRWDEAATALEEIMSRYPRDRRIGSVMFTLGRVERARGHHAKAAATFRACERGPLAEDALAEEAISWQAAGQSGNAKDAATRYLARYPGGPHVARMKRIVE